MYGGLSLAHLSAGDYEATLDGATCAPRRDSADGRRQALDVLPVIPASAALLGRIDEARAAWIRPEVSLAPASHVVGRSVRAGFGPHPL